MTKRDGKILVLGASGSQGWSVARHLLEAGFTNVHGLVRTVDGSRASLLGDQGVTLHVGELDHSRSLDAAMQDSHGVFCVLPLDERGPSAEIARGRNVAGDELTGPQVAGIYAQVTGQPARFEEQPVEEVRAVSPDFAAMFTWLNEQGFRADIAGLREDYPRLATFETWLRQHSAAVAAQP